MPQLAQQHILLKCRVCRFWIILLLWDCIDVEKKTENLGKFFYIYLWHREKTRKGFIEWKQTSSRPQIISPVTTSWWALTIHFVSKRLAGKTRRPTKKRQSQPPLSNRVRNSCVLYCCTRRHLYSVSYPAYRASMCATGLRTQITLYIQRRIIKYSEETPGWRSQYFSVTLEVAGLILCRGVCSLGRIEIRKRTLWILYFTAPDKSVRNNPGVASSSNFHL